MTFFSNAFLGRWWQQFRKRSFTFQAEVEIAICKVCDFWKGIPRFSGSVCRKNHSVGWRCWLGGVALSREETLSYFIFPSTLSLTFFFILNWTVLICDMIWNTMKTKCVDRLAFTELWCQEAFGKTPSPNTYKKSDQILYGRLLAFWSLQNRDELLWVL